MANIYTKSKTTVSSAKIAKTQRVVDENSLKVSFNPDNVNLIIEYLTNLYSNAPVAVVRELFTNACDADPNGFIHIDIITEANDNTFVITDNGVGMNKEQLIENYIQYANSSKTSEFDTVGSFGLGSKSPMAISGHYEVESSDGHTINKAIVQRIESGIYANVEEVGKSNKSYTKVTVKNISDYDINRMITYVQFLTNFSGRSIVVNGNIMQKSKIYNTSYDISNDVYNIELITDGNKGDRELVATFYNYYKEMENFDIVIRCNNTPYRVKNCGDKALGVLLIDVEPGYFAFAPSREEIPNGEKKEHILEIVNTPIFENISEFVQYLSFENVAENIEIFSYLMRKNQINDIKIIDKFYKLSNEEKEKFKNAYNIWWETEEAEELFGKLFEGCQIDILIKNNFEKKSLDSKYSKESKYLLNAVSTRMRTPITKFNSDMKAKTIYFVDLFVNCKKKRNGDYQKTSMCNPTNQSKEIRDTVENEGLFTNRVVYKYKTTFNKRDIIKINIYTDKEKLSEEAMSYLKLINIHNVDNEATEVEIKPIELDYSRATSNRPKLDLEDRVFEYKLSGDYTTYTVQGKDIVNKFDKNNIVVVFEQKLRDKQSFKYLAYKLGCRYVFFKNKSKKFKNYVSELGFKCIDCEYVEAEGRYRSLNAFTKKNEKIINLSESALKDYICENDIELVKYIVADYSGITNTIAGSFTNVIKPENTLNINTRSFIMSKICYGDIETRDKLVKEIKESFDYRSFFKKYKNYLINNIKAEKVSHIPYVFNQYFEYGETKKFDFKHNEWKEKVYQLAHASKEYKKFAKSVDSFKNLSFYSLSTVIANGLNMENPIHKFIKETMDKELVEWKSMVEE